MALPYFLLKQAYFILVFDKLPSGSRVSGDKCAECELKVVRDSTVELSEIAPALLGKRQLVALLLLSTLTQVPANDVTDMSEVCREA
ncbi:MAG: hypothetical protein MI920_31045 [Kiloniellales bacterium]|nr:hypothetical protein [Kiloniellales bacterium]